MTTSAQVPMLMIRMRCPSCKVDGRFLIEATLPLAALPEVAKKIMRCWCKNKIPKIKKTTPLEESLMSINGVPYQKLKEQGLYLEPALSLN